MTVSAFAKVNLTLEVLAERSDGYHALRSVVMPISLADTLTIETADELSSDTGYADDLCLKAARVLDPERGARIRVEKRIPVGGGLGGGSADAAATLLALNELWQKGLSRERLAELGAAVGSDVPSLVLGGPVLMEGRGEIVTPLRVESAEPIHLVLVNPGVFSSTAEVYRNCISRLQSDAQIVYNMSHALETGDLKEVASSLMNDLQAPAERLHPEIRQVADALRAAGADGVLMSGSGSTVFGLVPTETRGREIAASLAAKGLWARVAKTLNCPVV